MEVGPRSTLSQGLNGLIVSFSFIVGGVLLRHRGGKPGSDKRLKTCLRWLNITVPVPILSLPVRICLTCKQSKVNFLTSTVILRDWCVRLYKRTYTLQSNCSLWYLCHLNPQVEEELFLLNALCRSAMGLIKQQNKVFFLPVSYQYLCLL